ncbi:Uncharacterised protein [Serratia fonticola]|nr:Uncharacterised protein [Serratia fonticola]
MSATGAAKTPGAVSTRHNAQGVIPDLTVGIQKSLNGVFQAIVLECRRDTGRPYPAAVEARRRKQPIRRNISNERKAVGSPWQVLYIALR